MAFPPVTSKLGPHDARSSPSEKGGEEAGERRAKRHGGLGCDPGRGD